MFLAALFIYSTLFTFSVSVGAALTTTAQEKVDSMVEQTAKKLGVSIDGLKPSEAKKAVEEAEKKFSALQVVAKKLGISITGMTLEDAQNEVNAAQLKMDQLNKDAKLYNVNIKGLTIEKAEDKLDPKRTLVLQSKLETDSVKYGVDISGLSDIEAYNAIQDAISQKNTVKIDEDLAEQAKQLGVDITGLSSKEANDKIKAKYNEMTKENKKDASSFDKTMALVSGKIDLEKNADNEKLLKELKDEAMNLGIDIDGMSIEQAKTTIENEIKEIDEADKGQSDSAQLNQFLICALAVKANNESTVMNIVNTGLFEGVKIQMQGLSYAETKDRIIQVFNSDMGIDIMKSSISQIKKKFATAMKQMIKKEAEFYKVDINGLSDTQALAVIDLAREVMMAQNWADLNAYATALGVDISGMEFEAGWEKVKTFQQDQEKAIIEAEASRLGISINGMTNQEALQAIKIADHRNMLLLFISEATNLGIDVSKYANYDDSALLDDNLFQQLKEEIIKGYEQNRKAEPFDLQAMASKYGVDIQGLSEDEATKKVNEAIEASKNGK